MTTLKPKKKMKMEVKGRMRKFSLTMALMLAITLVSAASAFAATIAPSQSSVDSKTAKNTDLTKATLSITGQTVADPETHGDYDSATGAKFYLPDGVPNDTNRIHSNYSTQTDACAACHFTHTAKGARLLQWENIYKACAACHDGSLGGYTYDVFAGQIGTTNTRTFGGLFGTVLDSTDNSLSNHMPNGYMALSAAPGAAEGKNKDLTGVAFDCASCHTPHGQGGNARILSPDPGKMKISKFFTSDDSTNKNTEIAKYAKELTPNANGTVWSDTEGNWIQGYPYNKVTAFFIVDKNATVDYTFDNSKQPGVVAKVNGIPVDPVTPDNIDWRKGIVTFNTAVDPAAKKVIAVRVPGIFVAMQITNYMSSSETVQYLATETPGSTNKWSEGINAYCGACHGDYNTQGAKIGNASDEYDFFAADEENHGSGSIADSQGVYRHQVGFKWVGQWTGPANYVKFAYPVDANGNVGGDKIFTCLSCHFAHGVNKGYWKDYAGDTFNTDEIYGSSALKRLPNMSVCENCHDKKSGNNKLGTVQY